MIDVAATNQGEGDDRFDALRETAKLWPDICVDPSAANETHLDALLLCAACVRGDAVALRVFERAYRRTIRDAIARIESDPSFVDEVMARLLDRLLVGPTPRLSSYSGRGELAAWLKVSASRAALDAKRAAKRVCELRLDDGIAAVASMSPESLVFCRDHARDVIAALETAVDELESSQLELLSLHYVDGLSIDRIGERRKVHRVTVARWLHKARGAIDRVVRAELAKSCRLNAEEITSLIKGTREYLEGRLRELLTAEVKQGTPSTQTSTLSAISGVFPATPAQPPRQRGTGR